MFIGFSYLFLEKFNFRSKMIKKELFCKTLYNLLEQRKRDLATLNLLQEAFNTNEAFSVNQNDLLVVSIVELLHEYFPKDVSGFSEIEYYIFDTNFGKPTSDSVWKTPEMLYDELISKI